MANHPGQGKTTPIPWVRAVSMLAVAILALTGLVLPGCADAPAAVEPALLGAGELGPDWTAGVVNPDEPRWPWVQEDCPTYRDADFPAQRHRQDAVARQYLRASSRAAALQVVEAYESGWASRALDDVRRVLRTCGTYSAYGGQISFNLLDSDFAGDAALLIRGRISSPDVPATASYFVVVRRGDIVSTLNLPDSGGEDQARVVATRLASQLGQR